MNRRSSFLTLCIIGATWLLSSNGIAGPESDNQSRIRPYEKNPRYWQYKDKPVILLGGTKDDSLFQIPDLKEHLDELAQVGGNYIRNTMSDRPDKGFEIYPFRKLADGKYDLNQWNDEYWQRFENMLRWTSERDIVVQIEVWDRFDYSRTNWEPHPYNPKNNVNYTYEESGFAEHYPNHPGANEQPFFFTTPTQRNNPVVYPYQEKFVHKMLDYSLSYPNVLYCMDNETNGDEEWAIHWADLIHQRAAEKKVDVYLTEMWDAWDLKVDEHRRTLDHPERYAFADISQNNHQKDQAHWTNFLWVWNYVKDRPRPLNAVKIYGADTGNYGTDRDGIERFWRLILAGAAGARFHRPDSGLGLSETAQTQIRSARLFLDEFNIIQAQPDADSQFLSEREEDEAYLTRIEGERYAVYFPDGGEVKLDLKSANGTYRLKWLNITESQWSEPKSVEGGKSITLATPASGYWLALLIKE